MSKGNPRHFPNKPANKKGNWCQHCEDINGELYCMYHGDTSKCKGNPHNCIKVAYKQFASLKERYKDQILKGRV